ncbi:hypothetical protein BDR04DRAFT_1091990 [Suillus decipiens]|nr:hypothetical protein BDR04DRAFT_1091990 [Suillus decipiens]
MSKKLGKRLAPTSEEGLMTDGDIDLGRTRRVPRPKIAADGSVIGAPRLDPTCPRQAQLPIRTAAPAYALEPIVEQFESVKPVFDPVTVSARLNGPDIPPIHAPAAQLLRARTIAGKRTCPVRQKLTLISISWALSRVIPATTTGKCNLLFKHSKLSSNHP